MTATLALTDAPIALATAGGASSCSERNAVWISAARSSIRRWRPPRRRAEAIFERQVNRVIEPGGYLGQWCRQNGATASLNALYKSAYTLEAAYGFKSQKISGVAQLVTNQAGGVSTQVGMSMVPSIWLVNFLLLYVLNPAIAADMPANWAPIPSSVADSISASPTGQVPYSEFASDLH